MITGFTAEAVAAKECAVATPAKPPPIIAYRLVPGVAVQGLSVTFTL